jgi:hypothetical protein
LTKKTVGANFGSKMHPCKSSVKRYPCFSGIAVSGNFRAVKTCPHSRQTFDEGASQSLVLWAFQGKKKNHPLTKSLLSIDGSFYGIGRDK